MRVGHRVAFIFLKQRSQERTYSCIIIYELQDASLLIFVQSVKRQELGEPIF